MIFPVTRWVRLAAMALALYCGLADWFVDSSKLASLDEQLDHLEWRDTPLKDLQGLLAKNGVQTLADAPLKKLRPAIDHFFALPDVPSIVEQLRAVTVADSHAWATTTADLLETRSPLAMAVRCSVGTTGVRAGSCTGTARTGWTGASSNAIAWWGSRPLKNLGYDCTGGREAKAEVVFQQPANATELSVDTASV